MQTIKLFFIALKVWLIFAAASLVTSFIVIFFLSVLTGVLATFANPVSLASTCAFCYILHIFGVFRKIASWNIPEKVSKFYQFVGRELKPVLDVKL